MAKEWIWGGFQLGQKSSHRKNQYQQHFDNILSALTYSSEAKFAKFQEILEPLYSLGILFLFP